MNFLRWVNFFNLNSYIAACRPHPVKRPRLYLSPLVINFLFFCFVFLNWAEPSFEQTQATNSEP